jgi:DNA-binding transcriptional LysR family regulator
MTVGFTSGIIVTPAVRAVRHRHPDAEVLTVHLAWDDVHHALLEHRVDAVVTRLPFRTEGLRVTVLYDEPRVLIVPLDHRLAGKEAVTLDDIADERLPRTADPVRSAFWRFEPRPDGRPAPDGPLIEAVEDKFELVAAGESLAVAAQSVGSVLRPDLTMVPLEGVEPSHVVVATRADDRNRLVTSFRKAARDHLTLGG